VYGEGKEKRRRDYNGRNSGLCANHRWAEKATRLVLLGHTRALPEAEIPLILTLAQCLLSYVLAPRSPPCIFSPTSEAALTATPEFTARDVLQQVDRRLSLIEEDLRVLDAKIDSKFHLVVGLILASWSSMMGTFLLK